MKKTLIVLVVGILAVGCLTSEQKQKALRDSVVGEYEFKYTSGQTHKQVLLDNGVVEGYLDDKKGGEGKWSIVDGEIHVNHGGGFIRIFRINKDSSLTNIREIDKDGVRTDLSKEDQSIWKKLEKLNSRKKI